MKRIFATFSLIFLSFLMLVSCDSKENNGEIQINFVVDGMTYSTISTESIGEVKLPQEPTKDGYKFDGWYLDDCIWKKPLTINSLFNTPLSEKITIYAKFNHIECLFVEKNIVLPTCNEVGYTILECECGASKKTDYVLSEGHKYSEWVIQKEASVGANGVKKRICQACGFIDEEHYLYHNVNAGNVITSTLGSFTYETPNDLTPAPGLELSQVTDSVEVTVDFTNMINSSFPNVFDNIPNDYIIDVDDVTLENVTNDIVERNPDVTVDVKMPGFDTDNSNKPTPLPIN